MPFPWQTTGALRGGVPNQINAKVPQNAEGLGVPWGRAMFNLPRFQMPGSTVNFGGGFGLSGDMGSPLGQSQLGMQPGANIGNVRFSLSRQASSDPVQNAINDIQNPLGGMSLGFQNAGAGQGQGGLRQQMTGQGQGGNGGLGDLGLGVGGALQNEVNQGVSVPNFENFNNPMSSGPEGFGIGVPSFQRFANRQFGLKQSMLGPLSL